MTNIAEALAQEIQRNRELLEEYKKIPTGQLGAIVIEADIKIGLDALVSGDVIEIIQALQLLRDNE